MDDFDGTDPQQAHEISRIAGLVRDIQRRNQAERRRRDRLQPAGREVREQAERDRVAAVLGFVDQAVGGACVECWWRSTDGGRHPGQARSVRHRSPASCQYARSGRPQE